MNLRRVRILHKRGIRTRFCVPDIARTGVGMPSSQRPRTNKPKPTKQEFRQWAGLFYDLYELEKQKRNLQQLSNKG